MSIPEKLKSAYLTKDWELIADAYNDLTGLKLLDESLVIKTKPLNIQATPAKKGRKPSKSPKKEIAEVTDVRAVRTENHAGEAVKFIGNTFNDDGVANLNDHKVMKKLMKKLVAGPRTARKPNPKVKITCSKCKVEKTVLASKIYQDGVKVYADIDKDGEDDTRPWWRCDECS